MNVSAAAMASPPRRTLRLGPLVFATYFMVSGGPYGLEELLAQAGYGRSLAILLVTPFVWSLPTALLVGELASALPEDGGYYVWVRRALGPFWGFQEAWLSLAASVFDLAIYPLLFTHYLAMLWPAVGRGPWPLVTGGLLLAACALWNIRGAKAVGGSSLLLGVMLLGPFVLLVMLAVAHPAMAPPTSSAGSVLLPGILVAMWNTMGWDNAATVAGEVSAPQRTYPRAMIVTTALVTVSYVLPVLALQRAGIDVRGWTTGAWVRAAETIGGRALAVSVVVGGMVCAGAAANALLLSYSRLPVALAADGYLPAWMARRSPRSGAPWVAIVACALLYTAAMTLGFERLVDLDVVLYGAALLLEFVALVVLRRREPMLPRPFRVSGGMSGAVLLGVGPMGLLVLAMVDRCRDPTGSRRGIILAAILGFLGPVAYGVLRPRRPQCPRR